MKFQQQLVVVPSHLTMIFVIVVASLFAVTVVDGAAAVCEGKCEIPLEGYSSCEQAMNMLEFSGDCCALKQADDGTCVMETTTDCYYQVIGDTGCTEDENGQVGCVVPGFAWSAMGTDEPCPTSEFEIPTPPSTTSPGKEEDEEDLESIETVTDSASITSAPDTNVTPAVVEIENETTAASDELSGASLGFNQMSLTGLLAAAVVTLLVVSQ